MISDYLDKANQFNEWLATNGSELGSILFPPLNASNYYKLALSGHDNALEEADLSDPDACFDLIWQRVQADHKLAAVGGYGEKRTVYRTNPEHFGTGENERCIHIGTDIWAPAGTNIHAPLDAVVYSAHDNAGLSNYGPTVILEHRTLAITFYTLYGHLDRASLQELTPGDEIRQGKVFAAIGNSSENGNWPPHVHYQFITDMMGQQHDFIGVVTEADWETYRLFCPRPVLF